MALRVYNTLTQRKELFEPVQPGKVGIYLCGPTVYKELLPLGQGVVHTQKDQYYHLTSPPSASRWRIC